MSDLVRRPRRLRRNAIIRDMVAETRLSAKSMIQPYFVCEGKSLRIEVPSMPGIFIESIDMLMQTIAHDFQTGVRRIMLFGVPEGKDSVASSAIGEHAVANVAVRELKKTFGQSIFIAADVCLCGYTDSGHCGIVEGHEVDNDKTLPILAQMAAGLAESGADCVAPSDMMDGRVAAIREALDKIEKTDTLIMAYSAKYASAYYGPFRDAAKSAPKSGDRKGYQMDPRNRREARKEIALDVGEGADIVMVKPALAYLDVISDIRTATDLPIAAYNVSGEYAMVKLMARAGYADEKTLVLENLTSISRAGADIILTYHLRDILRNRWLDE